MRSCRPDSRSAYSRPKLVSPPESSTTTSPSSHPAESPSPLIAAEMLGKRLVPPSALRRQLLRGQPAQRRGRLLVGDVGLAGAAGEFVIGLDQQPVLFLFARPRLHAHQMPAPVEPRAVQHDFDVTLGQPLVGIETRL